MHCKISALYISTTPYVRPVGNSAFAPFSLFASFNYVLSNLARPVADLLGNSFNFSLFVYEFRYFRKCDGAIIIFQLISRYFNFPPKVQTGR